MDRFPDKMNIVQLAEASGFSVFDLDFYIQTWLVSKPLSIFYFTRLHQNQLQQIKKAQQTGYGFQATGRAKCFIGNHPVSL